MFNAASEDVWTSLLNIGIWLAAIAAITGLVFWRGRRRGSKTIALDAALTLAGMWVLLSTIGIVVFAAKVFVVDWAELHGFTNIWLSWPAALPCSQFGDSAGTTLTCSGHSLDDFTVTNASLGLRALAGAAQATSLAFSTMPAVLVAAICFQTLRGRTFSRILTRTLTVGAAVVLVLGIASDLLGSIAATAGLREVFPPDSTWYPPVFQLTVTPLPFAGALGLLALAAVFRQGMRLDQERERLQLETERLQKDTEGLV
ncbi:hypothetical protein ACIQTX_04850 [Microbacterium sp. NPDC090281]|uniref:hypothetical protein n=1 Tax=Microbacterium sp. NPDC090281 TaxID=3364208 RepID=UPI0003FCC1A6